MSGGFDTALYRRLILTRAVGRELIHVESCSSTNDLALASLAQGPVHGRVYLAEEQREGRGRAGRSWQSPRGKGLLLSVVLVPALPAVQAALVTLCAAVAVCETLREGGLELAEIKWPNDVLVGGRKVCGILCESRLRDGQIEALVVGIGLNVNQDPAELVEGATSIRAECGSEVDRTELLAALLYRFEYQLARLESGRAPEALADWQALSPSSHGRWVEVAEPGEPIAGISDGLAEDGALRVRRADGSVALARNGTARFAGG